MVQGRMAALLTQVACLALLPWVTPGAEVYDYSWKTDNLYRFYSRRPQCVDIPADLHLCHSVGYKRMQLPNLLHHETMDEVKQQAASWVPLLAKRCHSDTQLFLCTLFSPLCLDEPIYPCRSLCEAVRDSCTPVMESFGFPWPEMFTCDKFPSENDLCIPIQFHVYSSRIPGSNVCPPCENELKTDTILEHFCASDFALKIKIKEVKKENGNRKLIVAQKKKKVFKIGPLRKKDLKKMVLHIKNGADCMCTQLDVLNGMFLIMGRNVEQQLLLTAIYSWNKKSKELKNAVRSMKTHPCPMYHSVFH